MIVPVEEIRYALRSARRSPLLTCVVILALSVGIGLNAGVFTVLDALLLQPPTKRDPASFVQIYPRYQGWYLGLARDSSFNAEDYDAIRTESRTLADLAAWQKLGVTVDDVRRASGAALVTCNYFRTFGFDRPLLGRFFTPEECAPQTAAHIAVISEHFWRDYYSADPHIVGRTIHISRQSLTVVGVASDSSTGATAEAILIPYGLQPDFNHGRNAFRDPNWAWLSLAGRLRSGYTRADAAAELRTMMRQRDHAYLAQKVFTLDRNTSLLLTDGSIISNPAFQPMVLIMMALIMGPLALVLLLACTNVTMLFLSRSVKRRGEIAVRLALGAGRARLMRMLVLESLLTASAAGAASVYLAHRFPSLLFAFVDPTGGGAAAGIQPDWRVFAFLAALVLLATAASALAPMRESFRFDLITALKGREGASTTRSRSTGALIILQVAMSFVLLAAAVLFARLPAMIKNSDPGFETHQVLTVPLDVEAPPYTDASAGAFASSLESQVLATPGVQSLAWATLAPFSLPPVSEIRLENQIKGQGRAASVDRVTADFFPTFAVRMLAGRGFNHSDVPADGNAQVAVVSRAFARAFWGDRSPLGLTVLTPEGRKLQVVGVAADTSAERFGIPDGPRLYIPGNAQPESAQLYVRFTGDAAPVAAAVERAVKSLDSSQDTMPSTIWDFVEANATSMQSLAKIIVFMAGIAVLLAVTGVYGVLSFAMSQRTRELGIKMMLGATRQSIFRSVLTHGLRQIAIGIGGGLALALPAAMVFGRITRGSTLQVDTFDGTVYLTAALILALVSLSAMLVPAVRAMRVDPIQALRNE